MDGHFGHRHHPRDEDRHHPRDEDRHEYPPFDGPPPPRPPFSPDQDELPFDRPPPPRPPFFPDQDEFGAPPPPYYDQNEFAPPPTQAHHSSDYRSHGFQESPPRRPPPNTDDFESLNQGTVTHHSHRPHLPSFLHTHNSDSLSELSNKPTYKIYCKADPNFSLAIVNGKVVLNRSNPSDDTQKWYKDEKYSTRVKDEEGFPCFALVNKATGQAIKHSIGATQPVQLILYSSDSLDESILWSTSKDLGDGYRTIRMVNNIRLNMDAYDGNKEHGGVHDGTAIVLWEWKKGGNQRWIITPNCELLN